MKNLNIELIEAGARPWAAASALLGPERASQTLFFDHQRASQGGMSILCSRPSRWLFEREGRYFEGPLEREIKDPVAWMSENQLPPLSYQGSLPFLGGLAGFLGFEFDPRSRGQREGRQGKGPQLWVGVFESAAVFDHARQQWMLVGQGEGRERLREVIKSAPDWTPTAGQGEPIGQEGRAAYAAAVESALTAIASGEFSQVNYTERFRGRWQGDRRELYDRLRRQAPGDYGGLLDVEGLFLASISPEQFLAIENRKVVVRPIKGTRPRGRTTEEDERLAKELMHSLKDRAENELIVDLMRRDLARICRAESVQVREFCRLHSFPSVHHLISVLEGELEESQSELAAFLACFPAGSITGSPKQASVDWIKQNEPTPRGPYTGSLFYLSRHGRLDSNVLIRTAVLTGQEVEYGAGGAVVEGSDPHGEYEEALWKARPFFEALKG